ncbi:hypothetical protein [Streptomyces sp. N35]|uniref:hypothetical protein n=1 Tax=Streptomyces sp. N35 TaxID=2795730 RepID=UPI0018F6EBF3|nr:hypothetical protein [Streptomyces sp. N35]
MLRRPKLPRIRTLMLWFTGVLATMGVLAPAATAADDSGKYKPGGIGDMMPSPVTPPGAGRTLFESYDPGAYQLDNQLSEKLLGGDLIDGTLNGIAEMLMSILTLIVRATVVATQWCFNAISLPEIEQPLGKAMGAAAAPMVQGILPAALAVGMFIAWMRRAEASPFTQIAWVMASAALATTFLTAPTTWVKGVDEARQAGASVSMTAVNGALAGDGNYAMPFKTKQPASFSGKAKDDTIRKASDAVWRTYAATPWCIANFGSINACQQWGENVLKKGLDRDARESFIKTETEKAKVGDDADKWMEGHNPGGRIGVLIAALVSAAIFAALVLMLAFTTLATLIGSLMLLFCGVVFACLWCIPGRPRSWGVQWFETLVGLTLVSFVVTMLLGAVMTVSTAMMSLLPTYGWLMVSALNIAAAVMAFQLKGKLEGIVSTSGAALMGRSLLNTTTKVAKPLARFGGKAAAAPGNALNKMANSTPNGAGMAGGVGGGAWGGVSSARVAKVRTFPPPSGPVPSTASGPTPAAHGAYATTGAHVPVPGGVSKSELGQRRHTAPAVHGGPTTPLPATGAGAGGYAVRSGAPRYMSHSTPPPPVTPGTGRPVIEGRVVKRVAPETRFRTYPPPPRTQTVARTVASTAARTAVNTALTGQPLGPLPPVSGNGSA